jgi:PIN domain nuclease of toxin-antitoxin system
VNLALDTHALSWWLEGNPLLSRAAADAMETPEAILLIPTMVLVELEYVGKKKRVANYLRDKFAYLESSRDVKILPLDREAAELVNTRLNVHDAIIVATAQAYSRRTGERVRVVTKDGPIHESGFVDVLW